MPLSCPELRALKERDAEQCQDTCWLPHDLAILEKARTLQILVFVWMGSYQLLSSPCSTVLALASLVK